MKDAKSVLTTKATSNLSTEVEDELNKEDPTIDVARASLRKNIRQDQHTDSNKQKGSCRSCGCQNR